MSLDIARTWAEKALYPAAACDDAVGLFEQAAHLGVQATLLAAPELTASGKPCLVRWTGAELVVLHLDARQAECFQIRPQTMKRTVETLTPSEELPHHRPLALGNVRLDGADPHDGSQPLEGRYELASDDAAASAIVLAESSALRCQFFHPCLSGAITCYSYLLGTVLPPQCGLTFSFGPVYRDQGPSRPSGAWAMFLQLIELRVRGRPNEGFTVASNIAATIVNLR
ncbi:MAG TPA: hypothetical protein VF278_20115 [Pirellulales bacterium]